MKKLTKKKEEKVNNYKIKDQKGQWKERKRSRYSLF